MTEHQKDIPKNTLAPENLYSYLGTIFKYIQWCEALFQPTEAHEDATSSRQKSISADANVDIRSKNQPKSVIPFPAKRKDGSLGHPHQNRYESSL